MGTIQIDGSTPKLTIGNATAEDALILFDGNAHDFHIGLDYSSDDLVIGVGSTLGTTTALAIDENAGSTFSGTVTVGVDDTGKDVKFFGASAGSYALWDESANLLDLRGATAAGPGHLKLTTGELTVVDSDVLGKIEFQAPLESSGTDAVLVGASIYAEADDTFAAGVNNTDLVFALGKSEAAAEKFRFTADNEIGIAGANYGSDGQVLTSGGAGAAVAWEDASGAITALNNATANELVTVVSTTTELDAESTLTYDGTTLTLGSGRIKFPATSSMVDEANTIDDYEEGQWTPVLLGRDTAGTWTASSANMGEYQKIGNTVHLWFYIDGDLSSGSGELRMSGLPFDQNGNEGNNAASYRIQCDGKSFDGETPTNGSKLTNTTVEFYYHNGTRSATGVGIVNSSTADLGSSDVYLWGQLNYKTTN